MRNLTFSTAHSSSIKAPYVFMIWDFTEHKLWIYYYMVTHYYHMKKFFYHVHKYILAKERF